MRIQLASYLSACVVYIDSELLVFTFLGNILWFFDKCVCAAKSDRVATWSTSHIVKMLVNDYLKSSIRIPSHLHTSRYFLSHASKFECSQMCVLIHMLLFHRVLFHVALKSAVIFFKMKRKRFHLESLTCNSTRAFHDHISNTRISRAHAFMIFFCSLAPLLLVSSFLWFEVCVCVCFLAKFFFLCSANQKGNFQVFSVTALIWLWILADSAKFVRSMVFSIYRVRLHLVAKPYMVRGFSVSTTKKRFQKSHRQHKCNKARFMCAFNLWCGVYFVCLFFLYCIFDVESVNRFLCV